MEHIYMWYHGVRLEQGKLVQPSVVNAVAIRAAFLLNNNDRGRAGRIALPNDSLILPLLELGVQCLLFKEGYWIRALIAQVLKTSTGFGAPLLLWNQGEIEEKEPTTSSNSHHYQTSGLSVAPCYRNHQAQVRLHIHSHHSRNPHCHPPQQLKSC
ncbi:hypothetical protein PoB_002285300 [Plakobranchus ocellatus]|uniref:Uncharacterized protein n=1 Tax=Plakobranchus ocellatus TaxID=259542 RepID=A0AAV3ZND8_9GAST|nr:hypothetical protein PoB_002285300 [Plakobranchus ocellatus]